MAGHRVLSALAPGSYDVRIRDTAHTLCIIILNNALQITQPALLAGTVGKTDVTCFGANDGIITIPILWEVMVPISILSTEAPHGRLPELHFPCTRHIQC